MAFDISLVGFWRFPRPIEIVVDDDDDDEGDDECDDTGHNVLERNTLMILSHLVSAFLLEL